ncbi:MAG TPA: 2-amino-4-hydroxy-6-hydroxymethyldihydropteridine diphosphokinase [Gemmatimonadaceae bacterium]|nr:2-amino-4-hydroxy-6-hydroxymethyldihydropteridine diphosphokinase [Gemmatimonadaceae bacterium]
MSESAGSSELAYVAIGSNLGDRAEWIAMARRALESLPATRLVAASDVEETAPLGDVEQGEYLNQVVALETALTPRALLAELLRIERENGRVRTVRWGPRTLDLDIVAYDETTVNEPDLVVPHPELPNRDFWQRELAQARRAARAAAP